MTKEEWLSRYKKRFMDLLPDDELAQISAESAFDACHYNPDDYEGCVPEDVADDDISELRASS